MKKLLMTLALFVFPLAAAPSVLVQPALAVVAKSKLGDLSDMRKIVADTLTLVEAGQIKKAVKRITDYETAWDNNAKKLRKLDTVTWRKLDEASDVALSTVRYPSATSVEMKKDLSDLIALLDNPNS
jgi:hypothetical protein